MKRILLFFLFLVSTITMFAYDFEVDGIYYNITSKEKLECEVTHNGGSSYSGIVSISSKVTCNSNEYTVTAIGKDAFGKSNDLVYVLIPNSVTTIGEYAFAGCYGLTSVTIPNSVTTIGECAFEHCHRLTSLTIPNSVTTIGGSAFYGCSGLTSVTIPNSVTTIGASAFHYCSGLTSVTIPNSVTTIGECAFEHCHRLTSVTIPNSVTTIGKYAFANCRNLASVTNLAATPQSIEYDICSKYDTLHVYKGYKDVYAKAPYWKNFNIVDDVPIPKVSEIKLDKTKYYSSVGNVDFVAATCYPEEALEKGLIWSSSDPSIVFVDKKTGQFIALQEGTATITAKAADGGDATATATVIVGNGINPDPATPCATPIIAYENCKVSYSCETEGAECHTSLSCSGLSLSMQSDNTLVLNGQFTISVYATAEGYLQSETATKTITLENIPLGESRDSDGTITIDDITDLINRYLQQE